MNFRLMGKYQLEIHFRSYSKKDEKDPDKLLREVLARSRSSPVRQTGSLKHPL